MTRTPPTNASSSASLAVNGGTPVRSEPMPKRFLFGEAEKQAVMALFDQAMVDGHGVLGYGGAQETAYCEAFAQMLGGGYADAVNSGTNAVYIALRALEPEPGSEVIVPAISDPGGVMPVALCNCIPVPADCAPGSYNIGAEQIEARLTEHTSAIIVAHIAGIPADLDPILELARSRNIPVIEDCAQAHGATYKGKPCGSLGDVAAFSTMFGKHHATGGQGGVVFTRDESLYWRIRRYTDRGKRLGPDVADVADIGPGNVVASLNCNMDELHCAIGCVQLEMLPGMIAHRQKLVGQLAEGAKQRLRHITPVTASEGDEGVYWFLLLHVDVEALGGDKDALVQAISAEGLPAGGTYHVVPAHMAWARNRRVFGKQSALPWSQHPAGEITDPVAAYPLPNAAATDAAHIRMGFHEGWTEREIEDLLTALEKVEAAFTH